MTSSVILNHVFQDPGISTFEFKVETLNNEHSKNRALMGEDGNRGSGQFTCVNLDRMSSKNQSLFIQ